MTSQRPTLAAGAICAAVLLAGASCGDDEDSGASAKEITAVDYAYKGVPKTVSAGTRLTLENESKAEVHELVAARIPDGESRSAEELVKDPAAVGALFGGGPPAAVIVAAPGANVPGAVVGDGTLSQPGKYLFVCNIPTGADPNAYLEAARTSGGSPPQVPGGPPHSTRGMVAELTVKG